MNVALVGPVRVASLAPWLDGGSDGDRASWPQGRGGTAVTQLAKGLLSRGHSLLIVSLDNDVRDETILTGPQLRLCLGPFRVRGRARDALRLERAYVRDTLRREAPDLAHAHWTYEYALGALASGCPTIVTVRDWAPTILRLNPDPYRVLRLGMNIAALARAPYLTVASPYMQRRVERWTRKPAPVIPNALDDEVFTPQRRGQPAATADGPVLLAVNATFGQRKNVSTLLEAFSVVRERFTGARLRLIGEAYGPDGPAQRWAVARGLEAGVDFEGPMPHEQVLAAISEADLFVHPALEESFGLVLIEAMAHHVPVLGGERSGAVPWVLDDGRAGALADVRSAQRLADAIADLLANPQRLEQLGEAGFRYAREQFRNSAVVDRYLALYEQVYRELREHERVSS